jgi:hypothetical protein
VPRLDRDILYSNGEAPFLRKANEARNARAFFRTLAVVAAVLALTALVLVGALFLIFGASVALLAVGVLLLGPSLTVLAVALSRAHAHGAALKPALDDAWLAVAADIVRSSGGTLSAESLAQKLGIQEGQAEELLALLDVNEIGAPLRARIESIAKTEPPTVAPVHVSDALLHDDAPVAEQGPFAKSPEQQKAYTTLPLSDVAPSNAEKRRS